MKLELRGHDERYVVEQSLMNLFPGEKPEYPEGEPEGERCELAVRRGDKYTVCTCLLVRGGKGFRARRVSRTPE